MFFDFCLFLGLFVFRNLLVVVLVIDFLRKTLLWYSNNTLQNANKNSTTLHCTNCTLLLVLYSVVFSLKNNQLVNFLFALTVIHSLAVPLFSL
ncbi:hypothetical protein AQUCO_00800034v1 [Aquilegia coerulea]|uniref:Uncharacterized protein n=1 Tax=Aquilegia coerulea TaxID=218851 RepID=A0A2G5EH28_AQUCA|nr:hypothetical protein AQUCO_00800034v1 [Aquilegia coerulea]